MTMFYPGGAEQFLEAGLSISENVIGFARKAIGNLNARHSNGCRPAKEPALLTCALPNSDET